MKPYYYIFLLTAFLIVIFEACNSSKQVIHIAKPASALTGTEFYKKAAAFNWEQRDSLALKAILSGNIPSFLEKFVPVRVSIFDSSTRKRVNAIFYASPDYLSVGQDNDWARINISPYAAQKIADSFNCFLPTRKIVDDIYNAARVKLEPMPLFAFRDSTPTMWHHHLIIEGQRRNRKGLIAGIKKDVVISAKVSRDKRPDRVAIYGWHKLDGKPIQPLYTGHIYWWVDYSQGIRLISRLIKVDGRWMDYSKVMVDKLLRKLICDEEHCDFLRYDKN